eukprot:jgi/Bigna1/86841/estExt_fgenesh1_pg.C_140126
MDPNQAIGVLIELLGTSVTTLGLNLMKLSSSPATSSSQRNTEEGEMAAPSSGSDPPHSNELTEVWKSLPCASGKGCWWGAFLVFVVGQLLESLALYFCTQTVMATASNFAFVANALSAYVLFNEKFTRSDLMGTACMVMGTVVVLISAPSLDSNQVYDVGHLSQLITQIGFVLAFSFQIGCAFVSLLYIVASSYYPSLTGYGRSNTPGIMFGLMSACMASLTITLSKVVLLIVQTTITSPSNSDEFEHFGPYGYLMGWGLFQILTITSLNEGLRRHDSLTVVPVYTVARTLLVVVSGMSLYQLWARLSILKGVCFALGMITCVISVLSLDAEKQRAAQDREITTYWNVAYDDDDDSGITYSIDDQGAVDDQKFGDDLGDLNRIMLDGGIEKMEIQLNDE